MTSVATSARPGTTTTFTAEGRALEQQLVGAGRAHAALVFDGDDALARCQYGVPDELPNIYHCRQYEAELDLRPGAGPRARSRKSATAGVTHVRPEGKSNCVMRTQVT